MDIKRVWLSPPAYQRLFLLLCCCSVLLAGCSGASALGQSSPTTSSSTVVPTRPASLPDLTATANVVQQQQQQANLAKVQQLMQNMTLDDKLGQMLMVEYIGTQYADTELPTMITQNHVGGFLFQPVNHNFDPPLNTVDTANAFIAQAQKDSPIPLLVAIDQEGGLVNKLYDFSGDQPSAAALAATGDPNNALTQGQKTAQLMKSLGINVDLAPVVDVGPQTNLLESRQFSDNPQTVATYAGDFVAGLQQNGIAGCLKHFPGLGSLPLGQDPHQLIPRVSYPLAQLQSSDLVPYTQIIKQDNPAMIMTTDVYTDALDSTTPAELSRKVVTDTIRTQMGYKGVIITDGIYMIERAGYMPMIQAATQAIIAGNDIVEGPFHSQDVAAVVASLKQAVQGGQLTTDQVNQSVQRILMLKVQYGIIH